MYLISVPVPTKSDSLGPKYNHNHGEDSREPKRPKPRIYALFFHEEKVSLLPFGGAGRLGGEVVNNL